jgi:hypothetical protein
MSHADRFRKIRILHCFTVFSMRVCKNQKQRLDYAWWAGSRREYCTAPLSVLHCKRLATSVGPSSASLISLDCPAMMMQAQQTNWEDLYHTHAQSSRLYYCLVGGGRRRPANKDSNRPTRDLRR